MTKEAKPDAWMPLYIGDWDGDTAHLDCEQDGAYGRLIRYYWRTGPLLDDDANLARVVRMQLGRWRKIRPILAPFFTIADGRWTHKRVDAELVKWAVRKEKAVERAKRAAEGRWKNDATSNASSMPQAMLEECPSSSSTEVRAPNGAHTLCATGHFSGPEEVRLAFVAELGEAWCGSYLDRCGWQDLPERGLMPANSTARKHIERDGRQILHRLGLKLLEKAA